MKTTGYDGANMVPAGATIDRTYWTLPEVYTPGDEYPTEEAAIRAGIARWEAAEARRQEFTGGPTRDPHYLPLPQSFAVDLRWAMTFPSDGRDPNGHRVHAGGVDATIRRTTYASIDEAREHAERIARTREAMAGIL